MINYNEIQIAEEQMDHDSPYRVLIDESGEMMSLADKNQRAKGEKTYFDDTNPDNDNNGWYNFYFETNGEEIIDFYYEREDGTYCDSIEMTEEEKRIGMNKIIEYYGGKEEYKRKCEEYDDID